MNKIVILHGWGQNRSTWSDFKSKFQKEQVVTFDLPGFGEEPARNGWGIEEYAEWVEKRITNEGGGNIVLIGHSFGGRIAAYIASKQPPWLGKLVLYGAPLFYTPPFGVRVKSKIARMLKNVIPFKERILSIVVSEHRPDLYETFKKAVVFDLAQQLPSINAPTLLVWGEHDREAPVSNAQRAEKMIKNSSMVLLPKQGHTIHIEAPYLFYGVVKKFIENC